MISTPIRSLDLNPFTDAAGRDVREEMEVICGFQLARNSMQTTNSKAQPEALFLFAETLAETESVWIDVRSTVSPNRSFALAAGARLTAAASGRDIDGRVEDLRESLLLTFPDLSVSLAEGVQAQRPTLDFAPIRLHGLPVHIADLTGKADPGLLATPLRDGDLCQHILFGASTAETALSEAVRLLIRLSKPVTLRLTLEPRLLSSQDIRQLSDLYRDLADQRREWTLTSAEIARLSEMASLVATWLSAKSGVKLSVSVHSGPPVSRALASALGTVFSLPPSARRDAATPALDLAGCFVCGQRPPALTLDAEAARYLVPNLELCRPGDTRVDTKIGRTSDNAPVLLDARSRSRHLFICGATGTGKSTMLKNLIVSDIHNGHGVVLIDPHGDLFSDVLDQLNREPDTPVWVADTADTKAPYALNLLQSVGDSYRQNFVCNELIRLLKRSLYKNVPEGFGPMFEAYFRNAFLLLSDGGGGAYTISDMDRVFGDAKFRRELLENCSNEHVQRFWRNIASRAGGEAALENIAPYIVSKLTQFVGNPVISPIVCSRESTIDFNRILDSGGVCVVNLAKGLVGTTEAEILGGMFTTALFSAALGRAGRTRTERRPVRVYLDEFQSYSGEVISEMLAECRKYGLEMTLATQSLNRLRVMNGDLAQSVLGNAGNIVALRSGPQDADLLADWMGSGITRETITSLDDFIAIGRFLNECHVRPPIAFRLFESAPV